MKRARVKAAPAVVIAPEVARAEKISFALAEIRRQIWRGMEEADTERRVFAQEVLRAGTEAVAWNADKLVRAEERGRAMRDVYDTAAAFAESCATYRAATVADIVGGDGKARERVLAGWSVESWKAAVQKAVLWDGEERDLREAEFAVRYVTERMTENVLRWSGARSSGTFHNPVEEARHVAQLGLLSGYFDSLRGMLHAAQVALKPAA